MNPTELMPWLSLILSGAACLGLLKGYFSSGEKTIAADLKKIREEDLKEVKEKQAGHETKLTDHDRRIQQTENELRHLPSKDDITNLSLSLADLKGTVGILAKSFEGVSSTVHNIDTWLREKGDK